MSRKWFGWLKTIVVTTFVGLLISKIVEWCLPESTLSAIVEWEKAQLTGLASASPWELAARFSKLMQQHPNASWLSLPQLAVIDFFSYADSSIGSIVLIAEVAFAIIIVWTLFGAAWFQKVSIFAIPPIAVGIIVVASVINFAIYLSYAVILGVTLPIFQLGVLAFAGGTVVGSGVFALAENAAHEGLTHVVKKVLKID